MVKIPILHKKGYKGEVLCTKPTKGLCEIMLPDSAHIQESEAEYKNRKRQRSGGKMLYPLYTIEDARNSLRFFRAVQYDNIIKLNDEVSVRYRDAGHILGSAAIEMWVKEDEWIDSLQWQEEEAQEEIENLRIPVEKEGADIFYSVIGPEPKFRAQLIYQAAVIFNVAGLNWTMPATPGWDNSDMAMFTGDNEIMARIKRMHFETAMRLKVKRIVMGECGHAFRSIYDMGNRALGWRMPPVEVTHSIEFFYELIKSGKIKIAKKYEPTVTIHDPCNVIRGRGLHDMLRYVVHAICENVEEMHPNREHNFCCSAGGGVINCGPPWKMKRVNGNKVKAQQLFDAKSRGAETCVAPCHNCHGGLEDIIHHNEIGMDLKFLGDIIYEVMEKPESVL